MTGELKTLHASIAHTKPTDIGALMWIPFIAQLDYNDVLGLNPSPVGRAYTIYLFDSGLKEIINNPLLSEGIKLLSLLAISFGYTSININESGEIQDGIPIYE